MTQAAQAAQILRSQYTGVDVSDMQLRTVNIKYHQVKENGNRFPVPEADLRAAFLSAGIDLQLTVGEVLTTDPSVSLSRGYSDLVREYAKTDRGCGHLVIGVSREGDDTDIAGELHDLAARGLVSVYTLSDHIRFGPPRNFTQTIAHEIGHMLNLSHLDVTVQFDSAMDSLKDRDQDPGSCWDLARAEAAKLLQKGQESFYIEPSAKTACYPFALQARRQLAESSESSLQPWGSPFEHSADQKNFCGCIRRPTARTARKGLKP